MGGFCALCITYDTKCAMHFELVQSLERDNERLLGLLGVLLDCFGDTAIYKCQSCDSRFLDLPSVRPFSEYQACPNCGMPGARIEGRLFSHSEGWRAPDAVDGARAAKEAVKLLREARLR